MSLNLSRSAVSDLQIAKHASYSISLFKMPIYSIIQLSNNKLLLTNLYDLMYIDRQASFSELFRVCL